jgi:hypothetical protein
MCAFAASPDDGRLDDDVLHGLLVTELSAALDGSRPLVPLPPNVVDIVVGPANEPCFVVPAVAHERLIAGRDEARPGPDWTATAVARAARHEPGFRILWESKVLGRDGDRSLLAAAGDRSKVAVITRDSSSTLAVPSATVVHGAIRAGDRWVFLTDRGLLADNEPTVWSGSEVFSRNVPARLIPCGPNGLVALAPAAPYAPNGSQPLQIGVFDGAAWSIQTFPAPAMARRTVVRLADGRWLAIGRHIVELSTERPERPSEEALQAVVAAARSDDLPAFLTKVEQLASYPTDTLGGLAKLLETLPDKGAPLRAVQGRLEQMRRELADIPAQDGLDHAQQERVAAALAECSHTLRKGSAEIAAAAPELLFRSPAAAARYLLSGMQRYRGRWIEVIDVLRQDTVDSALLAIATIDETDGTRKTAVARVESDGSLQWRHDLPDDWARAVQRTVSWVPDPRGGVCGIVPGRGLARLGEQGLEWIGTADRLKGQMQAIGVDAQGRVYLREDPRSPIAAEGGGTSTLWVFTPNVEDIAPPAVAIWPIAGEPAADADGSVWFQQPAPERAGVAGTTLLSDTSGITATITNLSDGRPAAPDRAGEPGGFRLLRLDSPTSVTEYVAPELARCSLHMAGNSAAILERQRGSDQAGIVVIDGTAVRSGADIHALAMTSFDAMLAAAPSTALPGAWCGVPTTASRGPHSQLVRTGELLWVNSSGRIEVYDKGKPLSLNDRLILRTARIQQPRLVGPLHLRDGRTTMFVLTEPERLSNAAWVTPTDAGLEIAWAEQPPREWLGGILTDPVRFTGLPLVAGDGASMFACNGFGRVWQILGPKQYVAMPDTGFPILAVPGTDSFLAWRMERVRTGVRACSTTKRRDVAVTFTTRVNPVAFAADGRLLCLRPDGIAWLTPNEQHGYEMTETRLLPHGLSPTRYVATVGDADVLTATSRQGSPHLIVVRRSNDGR